MAVELTETQRTTWALSPRPDADRRLFPPYHDLVGRPFRAYGRDPRDGLDCLGVALWILAQERHELPDPRPGSGLEAMRAFRRHWERVTEPRAYDVLYVWHEDEDSVYTVLEGEYWAISASRKAGVHLKRLSTILEEHADVRVYRVHTCARTADEEEGEPEGDAGGAVSLSIVEDIFSGSRRRLTPQPGAPVSELIPKGAERDYVSVAVNGEEIEDLSCPTAAGDRVEIYRIPGASFLVSLTISLVLTAATYAIARATAPSPPDRPRTRDSATYGFDGIVNTRSPSTVIPIVYGEHRVGGHVLASFQTDPVVTTGFGDEAEDATGVLNTLLAVSSGGRFGIEGISSLRVDRNPEENFPAVLFESRRGVLSQAPIEGFEDVRLQVLKGDELTQAAGPITYTTEGEIDRFGIVLHFPRGLLKFDTRGGVHAHSAEIDIEYSVKGTGDWKFLPRSRIRAKTQSPRKFFVESPTLDRARYDIRLTRLTADDPTTNTSRISASEVFAVTEITSELLSYPGIAYYGVRQLPTNQFSGAPPVYDVLVKGRRVEVFTALDSFHVAWSDNPAWCLRDYMLDGTDGLGPFVSEDQIILEDFLEWGRFCDEEVDISLQGGVEPRYRLDYVVDGTKRAYDTIKQMASTGRAWPVKRGDRWGVVIDRDEPPSQFFSMGRIHAGSFEVSKPRTQDAPNTFQGTFFNRELDFEPDPLVVEDPLLTPGRPLVETSFDLSGTSRSSQARRILNYHMLSSRLLPREVELEVGVDALTAEAGQIAHVTHDVPQWGFSGKIRRVLDFVGAPGGSAGAILLLDRDVTIESGKQYELTVAHQTDTGDTIDVAVVANEPGTTDRILITQGLTKRPEDASDYAFGEVGKSTALYRIMAITRGEEPWRRNVRLRRHDPAVYSDDLTALPEPSPSALPDPRRIPPAPLDLRLFEEQIYEPDGTLTNAINVHFTPPAVAGVSLRVYYREVEDEAQLWELAGETRSGFFAIRGVDGPGVEYEVSVVSCSQVGLCAHPDAGARGALLTKGVKRQPSNVTGFIVDRLFPGLVFTWDAIDPTANFDLDYYEIRVGNAWSTGLVVGRTAGAETELRTSKTLKSLDGQQVSFWIKAVNKAGKESAVADTTTILLDGRINENIILEQQEDPTFPGTKVNCSVDGNDDLVFDTSSGTYTTQKFEVSSGNAVRSLIFALLDALQVDKTLTWDSPDVADETWDGEFAQTTAWEGQPAVGQSVRVKLEMRLSTVSSADLDAQPWKARSQGFEAAVKWAQARLTVEIDDPNFVVKISKFRVLFDVPDVFDSGRETTSAAGTIAVSYNRPFNAAPNVVPQIINASAGDELFLTNKDDSGFDLAVKDSTDSFVVRTVEWHAQGF